MTIVLKSKAVVPAISSSAAVAANLPEVIDQALDVLSTVDTSGVDLASLVVENPRGYKDLDISVASFPRHGTRIKISSLNPADASGNRSEAASVFIHQSALPELIAALVVIEAESGVAV